MNAHVAVKFIYVRLCKGTGAMHAKSASARSLWASICGVLWLASWVVSESIPGFNDILGLAVSKSTTVCCAGSVNIRLTRHRAHSLPAGFHLLFPLSFGFFSTAVVGSKIGSRHCTSV